MRHVYDWRRFDSLRLFEHFMPYILPGLLLSDRMFFPGLYPSLRRAMLQSHRPDLSIPGYLAGHKN